MPTLNVTLPDGTEQSHDLAEDVITVGRLPDNTLQIDDASVSSNHGTLTLVDGEYVLRDTGSTNGTRLNGQELTPDTDHRLRGGEKIIFGKIAAIYVSDVSNESRPLPAEEDHTLVPAAASVRPADFENASPFQTKHKKKDPVATALIAFSIFAMLVFAAAVASVFALKSPL